MTGGPVIVATATQPERHACEGSLVANGDAIGPVFVQTGVGLQHPEDLLAWALRLGPAGLVSAGTAGALDPNLAPGAVLLPERIRCRTGEVIDTDPQWRARVHAALTPHMPVNTGELLDVNRVVRQPAEKIILHAQTSSTGMDMESAALGRIAVRIGVPFLIMRVVMDTAADRIPATALAGIAANGDIDRIALCADLLRHPGDLPALLLLLRRFRQAASALRRACLLAGRQLLRPE